MREELQGQLSIWDILPEKGAKRKPCEYSFQRYMGQTVRSSWSGQIGKIVAIDRYYTDVECTDGEIYAWTPTNTVPFEYVRSEWHPCQEEKLIWDERRIHIPTVVPVYPSKPPEMIDLVIDGKVNGIPSLIGFKAWVSGFEGKFIEYEPVVWKEKQT